MKNSKTLFLAVPLLALLLIATLFSGCTGGGGDTTPESLSVTGSTTVLPVAQKAAEAYMDTDLQADIQVSGGGSSVGVQAVGEGTADIGMASRDLKDSEKEKYPDLVQHVVAKDGIAVIVHPANTVETVTTAQVKAIYQGAITNWKELGGPDMAVVVVGRDSASGTREFFQEAVMNKEDFVPSQLEKNSNGAVKQTIAQTPGAIGYVGLGYIDPTVKALKVDVNGTAVKPTVAAVVSGDYPIARSLNMFTKGEASGLAKEYLDFIVSPEGQKIVEEEGFVPVA
ncbi:MAG: phosphate ABC transporter substrate-binding protein [Methanofollis sp.]|uniref:phosphate ABC transporter substrate-binding protein n=1 Tax=Methanofollis sp. TaxID=2052835 RepID=UPI0026275600|nr:phosphate ABC transporter substrate-binding protein [Methanofollis sp.]MDD4254860.1 phosphate ABC transporter substrate-binding protein [Methanofollis sp.]